MNIIKELAKILFIDIGNGQKMHCDEDIELIDSIIGEE